MSYDPKRGEPWFEGAKPFKTTFSGGKERAIFDGLKLDSKYLYALFGEYSLANFKLKSVLKNDGLWFKEVSLVLPPDTATQKTYLESIKPTPSRTGLDQHGNVIVWYNLRPKQSINVEASFIAQIKANNYDFSLVTATNPPESIAAMYLEEVKGNANPLEELKLVYDEAKRLGGGQNLKQVIEDKLKQGGVASRMVYGKVLLNPQQITTGYTDSSWVEAFMPGIGWVDVVPDFTNSYDQTASLKVAFSIENNDKSWSVENYSFLPGKDLPDPLYEPEVTSVNNVILPGISVVSFVFKMPNGMIKDDVALRDEKTLREYALGSLAPYQKRTVRSVMIGASAFRPNSVSQGFLGDAAYESVLNSGGSVSYRPAIILGFSLAASVLVWSIRASRRHRKAKNRLVTNADIEELPSQESHPIPQSEPQASEQVPSPMPNEASRHTLEPVAQAVQQQAHGPEQQARIDQRPTQQGLHHIKPHEASPLPQTNPSLSHMQAARAPQNPQRQTSGMILGIKHSDVRPLTATVRQMPQARVVVDPRSLTRRRLVQ